jgi:predicted GNAT family acetyltransferase
MMRWHFDEHPDARAEAVRQLAEYSRREGRVRQDRRFAIASDGGDLAAITKLRSDGRTAQVEDVYTVPEARGRGYARALVSHAVALARAAGHELIFIVADDNDWPQQLYGRIGFEPIGRMRSFHLELDIAR